MDSNQPSMTICSHCGESFSSKGKYDSHYKREHQNQMKSQRNTFITRSQDGKFVCACRKGFKISPSLQRHQKAYKSFQDIIGDQELESADNISIQSINLI